MSEPYFCAAGVGADDVAFDFDIFVPSLITLPWVNRRVAGSSYLDQADGPASPW